MNNKDADHVHSLICICVVHEQKNMISPEVAHRLNVFLIWLSVRASTGKKVCQKGKSVLEDQDNVHQVGGDHQIIDISKALLIAKICGVFLTGNVLRKF